MQIKVWAMDGQPQWTLINVDEASGPRIAYDTDGVPYIEDDN